MGYDKRNARSAETHRQLTFEAEYALTAMQAEQPLPQPKQPAVKLTSLGGDLGELQFFAMPEDERRRP